MSKKRDFLFQSGVIASGDSEAIRASKEAYDKAYHLEYTRNYRANNKRLEVYFSKPEYEKIKQEAEEYELRIPEFIRQVIRVHFGETKLIQNPAQVQQIIVELKRVGNNINQLSRYANTQKSFEEWSILRTRLTELETSVITSLSDAVSPIHYVKEAITQGRITTQQIESILKDTERDSDGH